MAKYNCPIDTCNVYFNGPPHEIIPQAIGHAAGSHQTHYGDADILQIIEEQLIPVEEKSIDLNKWWARINDNEDTN